MLTVSALAGWGSALPPVFIATTTSGEKAADLLATLSNSLNGIAIAMVAAAFVLIRGRKGNSPSIWIPGILATASAAASIYAGYRFQLGLAEQLAYLRLDLPRIVDRLEWQGVAVLFGLSGLTALAVRSMEHETEAAPPAAVPRPQRYPYRRAGR